MTPTPRFVWLFALGAAPAAAAAWVPEAAYAAAAWDAALLLLLFAERLRAPREGALDVRRVVGDRICVGVPNECAIRLRSLSPGRMTVHVTDGWPAEFGMQPASHDVVLGPYEQRTLTETVVPGGRGEFSLGPIHVRVRAGLGLVWVRRTYGAPEPVRVYPNLRDLRRYELLARRRLLRHLGFRTVRRVGEGREFERLREYTPDDDFRAIDWKATARRRKPITRLYETERGQNVVVAVDAGRLMGASTGAVTKLDHAIDGALMLGHVAMKAHDRLGMVVFAGETERVVLPRAGKGVLSRMMETLVPLQARSTYSSYAALADTMTKRLRRRSLVVLFTDLSDAQAAKDIVKYLPLLAPRHVVVCVAFRDPGLAKLASEPPAAEGVYEHVAALELERDWRHTLGELRAGGVAVVDVLPEQAAVAAVNKYLELKKRQAI